MSDTMSIRSVMFCTVAVLVLFAGCGGGSSDHAIDTSKYSKACFVVSVCVAVFLGSLCCCGGGCPNTASATSTYAQYLQDVAANTPVCNPAPPCGATPGACQNISALCVCGLCTEASTSSSTLSGSL